MGRGLRVRGNGPHLLRLPMLLSLCCSRAFGFSPSAAPRALRAFQDVGISSLGSNLSPLRVSRLTPARMGTGKLIGTGLRMAASAPESEAEVATEAVDIGGFTPKSEFAKVMSERGFLHSCTDIEGLDKKLTDGVVIAYLGFDATAKSLHVGSLLQIMILKHLQQSGHKPIVLLGGGTTKVGDPTGKDQSRKMLTDDDIQDNINGIKSVFDKFIKFGDGPTDATMVNNDEWLSELKYLEFLRDYGPMFTINRMMSFESVKLRLERESPLTFLEFNYMILQAYDFLELNRRYGCVLQLGGSDQWGNMVNGVELTRRCAKNEVFAMTAPLIQTSDGKKMGKSEGGAIWLNSDMLSPYDYWQFWRNTNDADVVRFLKLFTELPLDKIEELGKLQGAAINDAKKILADETTRMLHGEEVLPSIHETAQSLFSAKKGGGSMDDLPKIEITQAQADEGVPVIDLFVELNFAKSKSECRKLIQGGGARLNDEKISDIAQTVSKDNIKDGQAKLSMGKKKHGLVVIA